MIQSPPAGAQRADGVHVAAARVAEILASVMAQSPSGSSMPDVLVGVCAQDLPISGVGLTWMTDAGPTGSYAATDGAARVMEELQFSLGEGPCVDCSASGRPVLQAELSRTGPARWPLFTVGALNAGIRAIFALPLQVGGIRLGVLDLYRDEPGSLSATELSDALAYADAATSILLYLQTTMADDELQPHLAEPMDNHAEVHQATGMTAAQLGVPLADALALLRAHAFATERPMLQVARDIVQRRIRLQE